MDFTNAFSGDVHSQVVQTKLFLLIEYFFFAFKEIWILEYNFPRLDLLFFEQSVKSAYDP